MTPFLLGLGGCPGLALTACLLCADPSLPRPSISLSPTGITAPGADVTIRCQGQRRNVTFFLHKAGDLNPQQHMDPAGDGAEFLIPTVGRQHGGSYSCSYRPRSEPFVSSQPSDTVQLVVAGEGYPKPSISLRPSGEVALGGAVTVRCWGRHQNMRFLLYKDGNPNVRRDAGSYSCYHHDKVYQFIWSHPSDPVELGVTTYSKPSISLHPSREVTPGEAVTVRCQAQYQNMRFLLYKDGNPTAVQEVEPAGNMAEFPIRNVSRRDAGSYRCRYSNKTDPPASSHPSDPVELVVAGEGPGSVSPLPVGPSGAGASVTVWCECRCQGARVLLSKAGDLAAQHATDPTGDVVEFPICNLSQGDAGNYSCRYSTKWDPPVLSEPSDPVNLVVAGLGPGSASLLPAPHPAGCSGESEHVWAVGISPPWFDTAPFGRHTLLQLYRQRGVPPLKSELHPDLLRSDSRCEWHAG
uniref:Ig-like domain-containing protein n=1 Tax=Terrapene triunguis TaxID=2587831 RepID=A0A674JXI2_9SAUR